MQQAEDGSLDSAVEGVATVTYENRKYPQCPEGKHPAICLSAQIKDANPNGKFYQPGDKRIHLCWQIQEPTYVDPEDTEKKVRNYRVWSIPMAVSFGERSNLYKLFKQLTGAEIEDFVSRDQAKIPMAGGKFKNVTKISFDATQFINMVATLDIEHQEYPEGSGEMKANIDKYKVSDEQRRSNFQQLPGMNRSEPPMAPRESNQQPALPITSAPAAPVPTPAQPTPMPQQQGGPVNAPWVNTQPSTNTPTQMPEHFDQARYDATVKEANQVFGDSTPQGATGNA